MDFIDVIRTTAAWTGLFMLAQSYQEYVTISKTINELNKTDVKVWSEVKRTAQQNDKTLFLVKDSFQNQKQTLLKRKFQIYSNLLFFNCFPRYRDMMRAELNSIQSKANLKLKQYGGVVNLPELANSNLLQFSKAEYKSIFQQGKDKPGILMTICKWTLAAVAAISNLLLQAFWLNQDKQTIFVQGPLWGSLTLYSNLIAGSPLVLLCSISNGQLKPKIVGFSKGEILEYLKASKQRSLYCMLFGMFMIYVNRKHLVRALRKVAVKIKEILARNWVNRQKEQAELVQYAPRVSDEETCIICYARCRNVIFRKCKHLLVCSQCAINLENVIDSCPMCRVNTQGEIIKVMNQRISQRRSSGMRQKQ